MASTDSTVPDSSTGDSIGSQGGQSFTDKAKTAIKGNIPSGKDKPQDSATQGIDDAASQDKDSGSGLEQNKLL